LETSAQFVGRIPQLNPAWVFLLPYCRIEKRNPAYGVSFLCRPGSAASSFAQRSAFFDMEIDYSEDYAGVSPQWLGMRVRLQGGLIPGCGDSFLCRPASEAEPGFMTDGHLPCAAWTPARSGKGKQIAASLRSSKTNQSVIASFLCVAICV